MSSKASYLSPSQLFPLLIGQADWRGGICFKRENGNAGWTPTSITRRGGRIGRANHLSRPACWRSHTTANRKWLWLGNSSKFDALGLDGFANDRPTEPNVTFSCIWVSCREVGRSQPDWIPRFAYGRLWNPKDEAAVRTRHRHVSLSSQLASRKSLKKVVDALGLEPRTR